MNKTILVALGGNAILQPGQKGTFAEQMENIAKSCHVLVRLVQEGYKVLVTHGNGPQVGNLLLQNEAALKQTPALPLHACVAQTQGQLGYMIQTSLDQISNRLGLNISSASIVTRVVVDADDPAFQAPSKPIGPFFPPEQGAMRQGRGETWINDSNRGWRRVVPSPLPREIVELEVIRATLRQSSITIAVGGGGIPVIKQDGVLTGVDAVIDKDLASSLLARTLDVDCFAILTDVTNVKLHFGHATELNLAKLTILESELHLANGEFGQGSMAPKVRAVAEFVRCTGKLALITSLSELSAALQGKAGTVIVS